MTPHPPCKVTYSGGEGEIRTLEPLLTVTRFPIVRARPATRLLHSVRYKSDTFVPTTVLLYHKYLRLSRAFAKKIEKVRKFTYWSFEVPHKNTVPAFLRRLYVFLRKYADVCSQTHVLCQRISGQTRKATANTAAQRTTITPSFS